MDPETQYYTTPTLALRSRSYVKTVRMYKCMVCGEKFPTKSTFTEHKITHTSLKPYLCPYCQYRSSLMAIMKNHINLQHSGKSMPIIVTQKSETIVMEYKCTLCKQQFASKTKFHEHHIGNADCKLNSCMVCKNAEDKEANSVKDAGVTKPGNDEDITDEEEEEDDDEEQKEASSAMMVYKCAMCDKQYDSKRALYQHNETHYGMKPYGCEYCDYRCNLRGIMQNHLLVRHGRKIKPTLIIPDKKNKMFIRAYRCITCKTVVATKERLQNHLSANKGCNRFKCMFCDYRALFKCTLKRHINGKHSRAVDSPELFSQSDNADGADRSEVKIEVGETEITSGVGMKRETVENKSSNGEENKFNVAEGTLGRVTIKQEIPDYSENENCHSEDIYDTKRIQVKYDVDNLDYPQHYDQTGNEYIQVDKLNIKPERIDEDQIPSYADDCVTKIGNLPSDVAIKDEPVFTFMYDDVSITN